jgi:hypothetical protein
MDLKSGKIKVCLFIQPLCQLMLKGAYVSANFSVKKNEPHPLDRMCNSFSFA